ncbi:hypothetical protein, partial [Paenarthrobacter ureafaciens]|uniref:hypothetical protein n=1 Tax=Paenarthrobacter ureafaciens TaxID=37931 RepID=UPI001909A8C5
MVIVSLPATVLPVTESGGLSATATAGPMASVPTAVSGILIAPVATMKIGPAVTQATAGPTASGPSADPATSMGRVAMVMIVVPLVGIVIVSRLVSVRSVARGTLTVPVVMVMIVVPLVG